MKLPAFIVPGTQKAATTTLHHILKQHPDIFLPVVKEVHFFDRQEAYDRGIGYYASYYAKCQPHQLAGDVTPSYMFYPEVPARIHAALGDSVRFIFMLRQPAERAWSHFLHMQRSGLYGDITFEALIGKEKNLTPEEKFRTPYNLIERGKYAQQITRFLNYFPKENMLFVLMDRDFTESTAQTVNRIFDFLGIRQYDVNLNIKKNVASIPRFKWLNRIILGDNPVARALPPVVKFKIKTWNVKKSATLPGLPETLKKEITRIYFEEDIRQLETIIQRDLSHWLA